MSTMDSKPNAPGPSPPSSSDVQPATVDQVLAMVDASLAAGDLGHAFSGYLFLLKSGEPGIRDCIEDDFPTVLQKWAEQQEMSGRKEEALWCYEVSRRMWPENAAIHNSMGAFLHRLGQDEEAESCFRLALEINPDCAGARRNLNNVVSSPFSGWHFPMLNDRTRNLAYQTAIARAVSQGHDTVLDIGSGTGLLSMFSVQAGAKSVYACEESKEMVRLSRDVLAANQMQDQIHLRHKLSTDMSVPEDIPNRVSLVVTEIFDAGLFGEGAVGTLRHAWNQLLLPPKTSDLQEAGTYGRVIPARAVVYAQVIQCLHIRKQYRLLNSKICNLDFGHVHKQLSAPSPEFKKSLEDYQGEPYTSERMNEVPFGYRPLTRPVKVLEIDFNHPQIITANHPSKDWKHVDFHVVSDGQVDAIISWFDLCLDDTVQLSSSPDSGSCWEQAVFPVRQEDLVTLESDRNLKADDELLVKTEDVLTVAVSCQDDCLHLKCAKLITPCASTKMESSSQVPDSSQKDPMEEVVTSFKDKMSTGGSSCDSSRSFCQDMEDSNGTVYSSDGRVCKQHPGIFLNPETCAILNDHKFNSAVFSAISTVMSNAAALERLNPQNPLSGEQLGSALGPESALRTESSSQPLVRARFSVVDISSSLPIAGLFAAKLSTAARVCIPSSQTRTLMEELARSNAVEGRVDFEVMPHPLSPSSEATWDVLVTDLVAPCGTLRERVLEDVAVGRVCALRSTGRVIPATLSIFAMCIECRSLQRDSEVLGTSSTMGFKVDDFINKHKVSTFLDLHLSTRVYKQLSRPFLVFRLDLNEVPKPDSADLPSFVSQKATHELESLEDGRITAVPFWFDIGVDAANHINTLDNETHWKQAAYLLPGEGLAVKKGDRLRVSSTLENSSLGFSVEVRR